MLPVNTAPSAKLNKSLPALPFSVAATEVFTLKVSATVPALNTSMLLNPAVIGFGAPAVVPFAPLAPAAFRLIVNAVVYAPRFKVSLPVPPLMLPVNTAPSAKVKLSSSASPSSIAAMEALMLKISLFPPPNTVPRLCPRANVSTAEPPVQLAKFENVSVLPPDK